MLVQNTLILGLHEFFKQRKLLSEELIVKYNVPDASVPTQLYTYGTTNDLVFDAASMFDKVVIDGTEVSITDLDFASGQIQFSAGEHTVKYTLKDPTFTGILVDSNDLSSLAKVGATFSRCTSITSVEIPDSVTNIGLSTFDISSLESITIPNSVTSIGNNAFSGCNLSNVKIPDSVISIGNGAFSHCSSLASVTIPSGVTSIGDGIFDSCTGLTSITIADSVISIGERTFYDCESLSSITIPDSVTSIGGWAFSSCVGLSSVTIGSGIITISEGAFNGCESLTSVTVEAATPPILNDYAFDGVSGNMIIYVPANSVDAYKSAWLEYSSMILAIEA